MRCSLIVSSLQASKKQKTNQSWVYKSNKEFEILFSKMLYTGLAYSSSGDEGISKLSNSLSIF
jgi:hypothetical protein